MMHKLILKIVNVETGKETEYEFFGTLEQVQQVNKIRETMGEERFSQFVYETIINYANSRIQ